MRQVTDELRGTPLWTVLVAVSRLERAHRLADAHSPLGAADRRLLWLLSDGQPRTMREVSQALLLEQSTVNRQVNAAIAEGLVRRIAEPGETARRITTTERGVRDFDAEVQLAAARYRAALAALPVDRVEEFAELLDLFAVRYRDIIEPT